MAITKALGMIVRGRLREIVNIGPTLMLVMVGMWEWKMQPLEQRDLILNLDLMCVMLKMWEEWGWGLMRMTRRRFLKERVICKISF